MTQWNIRFDFLLWQVDLVNSVYVRSPDSLFCLFFSFVRLCRTVNRFHHFFRSRRQIVSWNDSVSVTLGYISSNHICACVFLLQLAIEDRRREKKKVLPKHTQLSPQTKMVVMIKRKREIEQNEIKRRNKNWLTFHCGEWAHADTVHNDKRITSEWPKTVCVTDQFNTE